MAGKPKAAEPHKALGRGLAVLLGMSRVTGAVSVLIGPTGPVNGESSVPFNAEAKLMEEIGELQIELGQLQQVVAKLVAYPDGNHPDGAGPLHQRLEDEMGDVQASIDYVIRRLNLNKIRIGLRRKRKFDLFKGWDT